MVASPGLMLEKSLRANPVFNESFNKSNVCSLFATIVILPTAELPSPDSISKIHNLLISGSIAFLLSKALL